MCNRYARKKPFRKYRDLFSDTKVPLVFPTVHASPNMEPADVAPTDPAPDFSERLMWANFAPEVQDEIMTKGVWYQPNVYEPPRPITKLFIEDGRKNLILDKPLKVDFPVRILQGMKDADVPWQHAMKLIDLIDGDVRMTLIKDGEHRLSDPPNLILTTQTLDAMLEL